VLAALKECGVIQISDFAAIVAVKLILNYGITFRSTADLGYNWH
jgi:hypothetical protein